MFAENGDVEQITYGELDKKSEDLAAYLANIDIGPEKTIGVCLKRSLNLLIAILAVLKAGGVVVTMETSIADTHSTASSLLYKINDTIINNVIVDNQTSQLFADFPGKLFRLNIEDKKYEKVIKLLDLKYTPPDLSPHNLAYIMYTSGSTGEPKGVMIEHHGLTNLMLAMKDMNLPLGSKVLCTAPPTFDCFIWELLEAIVSEGECHLINETQRLSPITQEKIINQFNINCVTLLPISIQNLNPDKLPSLTHAITMGGRPYKEVIDRWPNLFNGYGPTETAICATLQRCQPDIPFTVIGKPICNTTVFILDENLNICPPNVPGEIFISGEGVARGYVDKKLTAEKFPVLDFYPEQHCFKRFISANKTHHFFIPEKKNFTAKRKASRADISAVKKQKTTDHVSALRLYATGDFASYILLPDQTLAINFIGRKDRQIKIHGVKVEIDGVESVLRSYAGFQDVYIKPNTTQDALIAYVIPKNNYAINKNEINAFLRKTALPIVSWPKSFMPMQIFPLTKNGKVDIKALPLPEEVITSNHPPLSDRQKQLCQIWANILHIFVNEVDIEKTFAEHGGDSIAIAHFQSELSKLFKPDEACLIKINPNMTIISLEEMVNSLDFSSPKQNEPAPSSVDQNFLGQKSSLSLAFHPS